MLFLFPINTRWSVFSSLGLCLNPFLVIVFSCYFINLSGWLAFFFYYYDVCEILAYTRPLTLCPCYNCKWKSFFPFFVLGFWQLLLPHQACKSFPEVLRTVQCLKPNPGLPHAKHAFSPFNPFPCLNVLSFPSPPTGNHSSGLLSWTGQWVGRVLLHRADLAHSGECFALMAADLWHFPFQVEQEDFVMEEHGKTPPPGEESKQWVMVYLTRIPLQLFPSAGVWRARLRGWMDGWALCGAHQLFLRLLRHRFYL